MLETMCRRVMLFLAAIALCSVAFGPADAQTTGEESQVMATAPVRLEGRRLFDVTASGDATAAERAARINRRLQRLVEREEAVPPFTPNDVLTQNGEQVIMLGDVRVMTITSADAEDALTDARELALLRGGQISRAVADARASRANALTGVGILLRNSFHDLITSFVRWLPRLAGALLLLVIFWLLARLANWITRLATKRLNLDPNLRDLLRALTVYAVWTAGLFAILSTLGANGASIATAVGVSGLVLGFAFQGILSHFLAGLLLLLGGKFRIGDQIMLREFEGTVERIELRAMHLRTYDNRLVVIPNADVFSSVVTSNTASPQRQRSFMIGIGYDDDIATAQRIAIEAVRATPGVLEEPAPNVVVEELAASTVTLKVLFWMNSLRADYVRVGSACMKAVKEAFDREGISMPTDIRTIVIKDLDDRLARLEKVLAEAAQAGSGREAPGARDDGRG
jgi:small conductance mechanosensitive channel